MLVVGVACPAEHGLLESMSAAERVYALLVDEDEDHGCGDLPPEVCRRVPGNVTRIVAASTLQKIGDRIVDPKTVLAWLLATLAAPAGFLGLLVPVREAGALLPQAGLVPFVRRAPVRKWVWVAGAAGQGAAVAALAVVAASLTGTAAALAVLASLAVFALARSLSSIAYKDVLGRTVPKGRRGQVSGIATVLSGVVAITVGLAVRALGAEVAVAAFVSLLGAAAVAWLAAGAAFATVAEAAGEHDPTVRAGAIGEALARLRTEAPLRRFVTARALLLVSALSPPFVVQLATEQAGTAISGLGPFLVASGLASLTSGRVWGRQADRSSRRTMMLAAAGGSAVVLALLAARSVPALVSVGWLYPLAYFLLAVAHTGARVGRKTYLVDLARGNERTDYVAVSNTAMGLLLLLTGAVTAALAGIGVPLALAALALMGLLGVAMARALPEVSVG